MSSPSRRPVATRVATRVALAAAVLCVATVAACSTPPAMTGPAITFTPAASPTAAPRPSSEATVSVAEPANGATIIGTSVHVVLELVGARIVEDTTTNIRPDEGHVHLYLNGQVVSMNYGLIQDLPVTPGTYVLRAEFVAADHAPFSPRVESGDIVFTVN
jgi:hypothetical protein